MPLQSSGDIDLLIRRARNRSVGLWVAAAAWILMLAVFIVVFTNTIGRFEKTEGSVQDLEREANDLIGELSATQGEIEIVRAIQQKHTEAALKRLLEQRRMGEALLPEEEELLELVREHYQSTISTGEEEQEDPVQLSFLADDAYFRFIDARRLNDVEGAARTAEEAAGYYERLFALGREEERAVSQYARTLLSTNRIEDAVAAYEKAVELSGDDDRRQYENLKGLGLAQIMIAENEAAIATFTEAITIAEGWLGSKYQSGLNEAAITRKIAGATENIALAMANLGRWQEALDTTDRVNELLPEMSWNWLFRAVAADQLGMNELATSAYERWTDLSGPGDQYALGLYLDENLRHYLTEFPAQ